MSLANKLAEERRGRLAAERMLELKQAELFAANRKLGNHARLLSDQIVETQAEVANVRDENMRVKSDLSTANQNLEIAERRLWHSIETIQDGFAFFDGGTEMLAANWAYLAPFDGLEEVKPGVSYMRILQLLTEEGIVNTDGRSPEDWRAMMIQRWQETDPEPTVIQLWNNEYIKLVDQRGPSGDVVSLALNITATVMYEAELTTARQNAENANKAKSTFLANMSHEIRTPMNGVVGMADVLTETELTSEQQLYVDTIKNSGEALLVIINDVLDYSKIEAEKLVLHPEPFDLERSLHEVVMLLQSIATDKGLDLVVDYDLFLPTQFTGDVGRIRQVLTNLIGNALKFTQTGHVIVRVTGIPGSETDVHIAIEDSGIGIPEEKVGHIFGEFNQVDDEQSRMFEGTGLGLAISKRLVEMMGGEVWVDSTFGEGSVFGFNLKLGPLDDPNADLPALPDTLKSVIVADTKAASLDVLTKQLSSLGLTVHPMADGPSVLDAVTDETSLILMEHDLTDHAGLPLAHSIRKAGKTTPILLLTAQAILAEVDAATIENCGLLKTPVTRRHLLETLTKVKPPQPNGSEDSVETPVTALPVPQGSDPASSDTPRLMRVLVAEDNKTNQLVLSKMVKNLEIELEFANNGIEAVAAYTRERPDLVFMDISMPQMDGKEATGEIRKLEVETGVHIPIIAVTAHAMQGDEGGILEAGLDDYLTKPVRKPALIAAIETHCPEDAVPPLTETPQAASG